MTGINITTHTATVAVSRLARLAKEGGYGLAMIGCLEQD
jgi:hypothetical protein